MQPEAYFGGAQSDLGEYRLSQVADADVAALGPADIEMQLPEDEEEEDIHKQWSPRGVRASEPATDGALAHIEQIQNNSVRAMETSSCL